MFWTCTSWSVQAVIAETLSQAIKLAEDSEISIRYGVISSSEPSYNFYFKVSFHHQFDQKLNEIGKTLELNWWIVVRRFLRNKEGEIYGFDEQEAMPHLTHVTIPAFLDAIKLYL